VNKQISRIAVLALLLIAALIVATTYWQGWAASSLAAKQDNSIQQVAQFQIKRGLIYASNGTTVLAANTAVKHKGAPTTYVRRYPTNGFAAQVVGYSTVGRSRSGIEQSENGYLTASNANLGTIFDKLEKKLSGATVVGNNVILNLDVKAQNIAQRDLFGKCGAAVVLNPQTGAVLAMASSPKFDPNDIESGKGYAGILKSPSACPGSSSALLNRATQGLYPPGSTFKTVTAAAALDDGIYTPSSSFYDPGYCTEYGQQVKNALDQNGPESYGHVNLLQAYQHSINAVFCNIGKAIGAKRIVNEAKKFGFYSRPPIELPADQLARSGLVDFKHNALFDNTSTVDPGRLAFGQERMLVTPLQMALVAAGVANGGTIMAPHLVKEVRSPSGGLVMKTHPSVWKKNAMKPQTAADLNTMMQAVVEGGTGTSAQIPGVKVAGKTGTAETCSNCKIYDAWFIFFAPADHPTVAGAVVVEHSANGFGGAVAAPIAKDLMQALLPAASKG
jgi:peptidoglycan glycosyltransferase